MLTLFMVVSGGVNWHETMKPLRAISPLAVVCMVIYIVISIFTILNVAGASAQRDVIMSRAPKD